MIPPTKNQQDLGIDNPTIDASDGATIELYNDLTENKDMARQEFAKDADINYMLHKFGITPARGEPTYGEWDDTIDLQTALAATTEARTAYSELPKSLQDKFGSIEELLTAYQNGSLQIKEGEEPIPPKTETQILQERIDALQQRLDSPSGTGNPA